jgi:hypothetical protein
MRSALAILCVAALVSCRSRHAPAAGETITENTVKAMSHALLDAYDRADDGGFARALGPSFVLFDDLRLEQREQVIGNLRKRRARRAPNRTRTYGQEHVTIGDTSAVFIGETVEHYPVDDTRPCEDWGRCIDGDFDGWNTIVWVRDSGTWKVAS